MTKNNKVANTSTENKQKLNEKDLKDVAGGHELTGLPVVCPSCGNTTYDVKTNRCTACGYRV